MIVQKRIITALKTSVTKLHELGKVDLFHFVIL